MFLRKYGLRDNALSTTKVGGRLSVSIEQSLVIAAMGN